MPKAGLETEHDVDKTQVTDFSIRSKRKTRTRPDAEVHIEYTETVKGYWVYFDPNDDS